MGNAQEIPDCRIWCNYRSVPEIIKPWDVQYFNVQKNAAVSLKFFTNFGCDLRYLKFESYLNDCIIIPAPIPIN